MAGENQIVFYDIASAPPRKTFAPNPWKTRYALNFKGVDYRTEWVELPDVARTRKALGVPPCRTHPDGEPFYTLPIIKDLSTGEFVGDTFDIAVHLDKQYPDRPRLIPPQSTAVFKAFNTQMDAIFTSTVLLWCQGMPFNPANAEEAKAEFCRRAKAERFEQLTIEGEARQKLLEDSEAKLGELAAIFRDPNGPFLEADGPTYADIIIGAWVATMNRTLPEEDWKKVASWHDGRWGKLHEALQNKYAEIK